jgi:hypothetical protein
MKIYHLATLDTAAIYLMAKDTFGTDEIFFEQSTEGKIFEEVFVPREN